MKGVYSGAVTFAFTTDMLSFQSESGSLAVSGSISFQEEFTHV